MLGIDIGHGAIKLVVMNRQRRGWELQAYAVQRWQNAVDNQPVFDSDALQEGLSAALGRLPGKVRDAALALSCSEAITRTIRLEAGLSDQDIENRIAIEAEQHLPFSLSEASLDFCRLPASSDGIERAERADAGASGQDVLLVACRQGCVEERVCLLSGIGIRPVVVDLDALALCRVAGPPATCAPYAMLDLGATGFRLHVFAGGRLLYSRAHQAAPAVVEQSPGSGYESRLLQEVKRAFQLFLISTACKELVSITLVGGLASSPGLAANISKVCGRPASPLSAPDGITVRAGIELARWHSLAPQLALACALAMRVA